MPGSSSRVSSSSSVRYDASRSPAASWSRTTTPKRPAGVAEPRDLGLEAGASDDFGQTRLVLARAVPPRSAELADEVVEPDAATEEGGHAAIFAVKVRRDRRRHQPRMGVQELRNERHPA